MDDNLGPLVWSVADKRADRYVNGHRLYTPVAEHTTRQKARKDAWTRNAERATIATP